MEFIQLHHLSLTIWMGWVVLEDSRGLSSENVLPVKMVGPRFNPQFSKEVVWANNLKQQISEHHDSEQK